MKKIDPKLRERSIRLQRFETLRCLRACGKRKAKHVRAAIHHASRLAAERIGSVVTVPKQLRYYTPREPRRIVEAFFETVDSLLCQGARVTIDFSKVERLYPCGLLILMGWVDEWVASSPDRIGAIYPSDDLVEQMLQHVEILQKLGLPPRKEVVHDDVRRWHYFSGKNADATPIEPFMLDLQALIGEEKQLGLGNCVTEAMINVGHHAYQGDEGGPWWIFATVSNRTVFIALHDRGDSVPGTLLAKPAIMDVLKARMWVQGRADGKLITSAVGGRTRTELPYRGKGLPEMLEFTKSHPNSELGIYSRSGFFRFDGAETSGKLTSSIKGTLIIWILKISES